MTTFRRFLVVQSLLAWQGGFFFYAVVVVPVGTRVLESASLQGAITQSVSNWLNVFGGIALAVLAWDQLATRSHQRGRWATWVVMALTLLLVASLHHTLDALFDAESATTTNRATFKFWHGVYLWTMAAQWLAALVSVWLSLMAWHRQSKGAP